MRSWPLVAVALSTVIWAIGCQPGGTANDFEPKPPPAPTHPVQTPDPAPATPIGAKLDNPNRIYQLKDLKVVPVKVSGRTIDAWVMDDVSKRQEGLMFVTDKEIKPDQGMLFVFAGSSERGFWMKNTLIPLDIVYISDRGEVVSISRGKPHDETNLPSDAPAKYVLELKAGEAAAHGIRKGTKLEIPEVSAIE